VGLAPTFCFRQMYKQNQILVKLLEPVILAMGYEMWGIEHVPEGKGSRLRIYIDSESGITLSDCERVSKQVTGVLDVNDPVKGAYNLEISSPGLDRPLFKLEQFERFIGHKVRIRLGKVFEDRKNISGRIIEINDTGITVQTEESSYTIPADIIDKAHLEH